MKNKAQKLFFLLAASGVVIAACKNKKTEPSAEMISTIHLKRGAIIACGPPSQEFGAVSFALSAGDAIKKDFNMAMALLHSFEYDESEKAFARIIDEDPGCAMAYWGVAMSNFHPLWMPPSKEELEKGARSIGIAQSIKNIPDRENAYINGIAAFYNDYQTVNHITRCRNFEKAMGKLHADYPDDKEAAALYALALNAAADPADMTYTNQKKANAILNALYPGQPGHPGIVHYIIHTNDNPEMAATALEAAREYASIAPSSAHALHMPSHIFTRLGLWDEGIQSNLASVSSAKCYAEASGIKGHWDEEFHGLDYLVYSYLQKGMNDSANALLSYLLSITEASPFNFKVAYAFSSIPSRYALENKDWKNAAALQLPHPGIFPWKDYPWQEATIHFTRLMGLINSGNINSAKTELASLGQLHDELVKQKDDYKARQVKIKMIAGDAWIHYKTGNSVEALRLAKLAAAIEDSTEKHPVSPGEIIPARELLADLQLALNQPAIALVSYEQVLKKTPNRFNALFGAAVAAERSADPGKANEYYTKLVDIADPKSQRPELVHARAFIIPGLDVPKMQEL